MFWVLNSFYLAFFVFKSGVHTTYCSTELFNFLFLMTVFSQVCCCSDVEAICFYFLEKKPKYGDLGEVFQIVMATTMPERINV